MYNFFVDESKRQGNFYLITDDDYNHIKNVLRMKEGDNILVSSEGNSHLCAIKEFSGECAVAEIVEENFQDTALPVKLYLFQGLPKSDKMEFVIQKAVELGAEAVVPVEMSRCVVKLDDKKKKSKTARWQAISESAAKQSKRTTIPKVYDVTSYKEALKLASELDLLLVPYECKDGMLSTKNALKRMQSGMSVGILIGPEGGFDEKEIALAEEKGGLTISLGKRILRTETAAVTALSMCMLYAETELSE